MSVVIIPAYQPDETLVLITEKLWDYGCRILVVDDGSGDKYQSVFNRIKDKCIILAHSENQGKGAAIKTALDYIKNEFWEENSIGVMDSDGQHLPEDMMKLLIVAEKNPKTMVLGVRQVGKDMPLKSRLGNQITRIVFKLASGVKVTDTQTGLRAFDRELLDELLLIEGERYEYEMNVLMSLVKSGIPFKEVPIQTIYRDGNNSNSHFRVVKDSIQIYKEILKFTLSSFSSFLLDYLLFAVLMLFLPHTAVPVLIANVTARIISAFYNYSMNCHFVFHTERKACTALQYFELAIFILVMNNCILEIFVQYLHFSVFPAKILTESILFMISWLVQNYMIFKKEKRISSHGVAILGKKAKV